MFFVGIDLAWSNKNGTGVAILKGDEKSATLLKHGLFFSDNEIVEFVKKEVREENALVAIDAPLVVPNETGRRVAEKIVGDLFRKYDAGAHPSNRKRLSQWTGCIRGEVISKLLEENGFSHEPSIERFETSRKFFEVYPHPSMVVLFNLKRILRYKLKPNRDYKFRWTEFSLYQKKLKALQKAEPALFLGKEILNRDVTKMKGKELKGYEDLLDAMFCAYIAFYYWTTPNKCAVLGNLKDGYILTPIFDSMKQQIESSAMQKSLKEFSD